MRKVGSWADKNLKYLFTIPTTIFVLCMILFPILYTFTLSFHSWRMSVNIPWEWIGLENYINLFTNPRFGLAVWRTFLFAGLALFFQVVLGVGIALGLNRSFAGKNLVKTAFLLPMVATPVAVGMVWKLIYEPSIGILNYVIRSLGGPKIDWLGSTTNALFSLVVVDVWQWTPMVMLIVLAGLSAIPTDSFDSAKVDGANWFQTTTKVTLPLIRSAILTATLLRLIDVLKTFDIIYSMTLGGPGFSTETLNILSYKQAFEYLEFGEASATLITFFIIVMVIAGLMIKFKSKVEVEL